MPWRVDASADLTRINNILLCRCHNKQTWKTEDLVKLNIPVLYKYEHWGKTCGTLIREPAQYNRTRRTCHQFMEYTYGNLPRCWRAVESHAPLSWAVYWPVTWWWPFVLIICNTSRTTTAQLLGLLKGIFQPFKCIKCIQYPKRERDVTNDQSASASNYISLYPSVFYTLDGPTGVK